MILPIYHRDDDNKLRLVNHLNFREIGTKLTLVADVEKSVGVAHTKWTGNPHLTGFLFPKGSTTTFELRDDKKIYITCDQPFECEGRHSYHGPYDTQTREPNVAYWISGEPARITREDVLKFEAEMDDFINKLLLTAM